ncbi:MAG: OmpA family protein [Geobacteraceae bacterium]|nr:OmpA family protein [Geobacteraceae bacterium]
MKRRTMVNMLLIAFMLSALGCAQNESVKKDEGLVPAASQPAAETRKAAPSQPMISTAVTTSAPADQARQIVPAGSSADSREKDLAQSANSASSVYFGFDSYVLTTESGNTLQADFKSLANRPAIRIEGNCDEQGSSEYNLALGERRAIVAQNYLVTLGYPAARITTVSYGKERPAVLGHDETAWAKNRRDELIIVK